ncbi:NADP-dependent oxidoreductase [Saccharopolyspora sp. HNM0986]|uniref:NADP-dependent oxidoreductase n=1 Tax=Saccharopolyspora galaxeae TaxID=2781241 RepID=UPI00190C09ED|nr:NADP-dependent oxidoreductase [Saccharopolyspora sp. HNM0986]MBK0866344.1 NADP-dependent oxidoreductase [Saccharopolyspora sp. HNM0986]
MRAIGVSEFGGPDVLREFQIPERHAGPGEVRIDVRAAAVNPTDTVLRSGAYAERLRTNPPPYVPGMDVAGVLDEVGSEVSDLAVGEHVMAIVVPDGAHGGYSESLVLPERSVVRVPAGADDVAAASLPMNALTARQALDLLELQPGQTLAVTGAAGAFGGHVVQLAKADGLKVIADAADKDRELVRSLGADVIVERGDDVAKRLREVEPEGVHAVADGAVHNELVLPAVRDGGRVATVRFFSAEGERGITYHPVSVRDYQLEKEKLDRLRAQVEEGVLSLRVAQTFSADQAPEAHRALEAGGARGRMVLMF